MRIAGILTLFGYAPFVNSEAVYRLMSRFSKLKGRILDSAQQYVSRYSQHESRLLASNRRLIFGLFELGFDPFFRFRELSL